MDRHAAVRSFVKNAGLQFEICPLRHGEEKHYLPDFVVRLETEDECYLVVELKGSDWDGQAEVKARRPACDGAPR